MYRYQSSIRGERGREERRATCESEEESGERESEREREKVGEGPEMVRGGSEREGETKEGRERYVCIVHVSYSYSRCLYETVRLDLIHVVDKGRLPSSRPSITQLYFPPSWRMDNTTHVYSLNLHRCIHTHMVFLCHVVSCLY